MQDDVLFWKYDCSGVAQAQKAAARKDIEKLSKQTFEIKSVDELRVELASKYSLEVPKLQKSDISVKLREVQIDVRGDRFRHYSSGGPHYVTGTAVDVRMPFTGDAEMFQVKPNIWTTSIPRGRVQSGALIYTVEDTSLSQEKVKSEIDFWVASVETWLGHLEQSISSFPQELSREIEGLLVARKMKVERDSSLISGLGYRIE